MATNFSPGSAKIYQFPTRVRPTIGGHREEPAPVVDLMSPRLAQAAFGGGWYHEEAIQEAERARKQ